MTTALLKLIHTQDQEEMAARHNQSNRRAYETRWVIERMKNHMPPEHVSLARQLRDLGARSRGIRLSTHERVDCGNGTEAALLSRLDAATLLEGYARSVEGRLMRAGRICLDCIVGEYTMAETLQTCGYAAKSWQSVRRLVQLTMLAASDYSDECAAQRAAWRAM